MGVRPASQAAIPRWPAGQRAAQDSLGGLAHSTRRGGFDNAGAEFELKNPFRCRCLHAAPSPANRESRRHFPVDTSSSSSAFRPIRNIEKVHEGETMARRQKPAFTEDLEAPILI